MNVWEIIGYCGQFLFGSRFLVQWIASERARKSIVPLAFWYLSIGGSVLLLIYAVQENLGPIILGQSCGLLIYMRNLALHKGDEPGGAKVSE